MSQNTQAKIIEFFDRKASQYPRLDLYNQTPEDDRLNRFL